MKFVIKRTTPRGDVKSIRAACELEYVDGSFSVKHTGLAAETTYVSVAAESRFTFLALDSNYVNPVTTDMVLGNFLLQNTVVDSLDVSDSGVAVAQSYAASPFYFQGDYVGESRTF